LCERSITSGSHLSHCKLKFDVSEFISMIREWCHNGTHLQYLYMHFWWVIDDLYLCCFKAPVCIRMLAPHAPNIEWRIFIQFATKCYYFITFNIIRSVVKEMVTFINFNFQRVFWQFLELYQLQKPIYYAPISTSEVVISGCCCNGLSIWHIFYCYIRYGAWDVIVLRLTQLMVKSFL